MNFFKKWSARRRIIKKIKSKDLSADDLKLYVNYITRYDTNKVDEYAVACSIQPVTGVYSIIIDGREDVNVEVSMLGQTIFLRVYFNENKRSTIERNFSFRDGIQYDKLTETPLVDCSSTLDDIIDILCNSIFYTIKNYTKGWWRNESGLKNSSK